MTSKSLLSTPELLIRPRRNRQNATIRKMVEETDLRPADLVAPFFVVEGANKKESIASLPGIYRMSVDHVIRQASGLHQQGIPAIALFPVIDSSQKNFHGSEALNPQGVIPKAVQMIKKEIPSLCIITDVALDPFTSHGHDGLVDSQGYVLNDPTVAVLCEMAQLYASAGADLIAPSDMMDGRVRAIRKALDLSDLHHVGILSYTAKYASTLYAPFRDAVGSRLEFGDKKTYQMDPANRREAIREALLDVEEGADMLMVKPALFYLDIISHLRSRVHIPLCAYHVSGEYAMVMAAHANGWLNASQVFHEALLSIKRAGADLIFTYAIHHVLEMIT